MLRRLGIVLIAVSIGALLVTGVALATHITVDGNGADWIGNPITRTPGIQPCVPGPGCAWVTSDVQGDVNTPPAPQYDLSDFWVTNDSTNLYFRTDTYSDTGTWTGSTSLGLINICLDSDNNATTGVTQPPGWCNKDFSMPGVDHILSFQGTDGFGDGLPTPYRLYDCNPGTSTCVVSNTGTLDLRVGYSNNGVTEYSVPAADLNIPAGAPNQPIAMTVGIYFDNGGLSSEDSIPNTPPFIPVQFGCSTSPGGPCSPTAITLTSMSADAEAKNTTPLILAGASVVCAAIAVFLIRRRKAA